MTSFLENLYEIIKRLMDIVLSTLAIVILSPLYLLISYLIKLEGEGPIIYKQKRVGKGGKEFWIYKFRTMYADAEERLNELLEKYPDLKREWEQRRKLKNDPRITKIGKILRRTSMDELPQFWNVLKGDMSLVGPRPIVKEELEKHYGDRAKHYTKVKPGITGYWQVSMRNEHESYEDRVKMELWYIEHRSLWLDLKILLRTAQAVLKGHGAY